MRDGYSTRSRCAVAAATPLTEDDQDIHMAAIPELDLDLYDDDTLLHTRERYRAMRDSASIVHLPANGMYAVTRYDSVRAALRADDVLISGRGVGGNALVNDDRTPTEITLSSDGDIHKRRRAVLTVPLTPAAMRDIHGKIARYADELVVNLARRSDFCVVKDFCSSAAIDRRRSRGPVRLCQRTNARMGRRHVQRDGRNERAHARRVAVGHRHADFSGAAQAGRLARRELGGAGVRCR